MVTIQCDLNLSGREFIAIVMVNEADSISNIIMESVISEKRKVERVQRLHYSYVCVCVHIIHLTLVSSKRHCLSLCCAMLCSQ